MLNFQKALGFISTAKSNYATEATFETKVN